MDDKERRVLGGRIEVRGDDGKKRIVGYAAVFNKLSEDLGGFREQIAPGAFDDAVKDGADVRALVDHDTAKPIGRTTNGTLRMEQNTKGLKVGIKPADTTAGRDITESIARGDVTGMSFAFRTLEDDWHIQDGQEVRTLRKVELFEVSPVTFPAYPDTSLAMRSRKSVASRDSRKLDEDARQRLTIAAGDVE